MEYTEKQMKEFLDRKDKEFSDLIRNKYILVSEHKVALQMVESKRKKEFRILFRAMQDLNKTIGKLRKQEAFLNELLDEREDDLNKRKSQIRKVKEDLQ